MEYDKCNIRKVKHVRRDNSQEDGYVLDFIKDGVIKLDIFVKDVTIFDACNTSTPKSINPALRCG